MHPSDPSPAAKPAVTPTALSRLLRLQCGVQHYAWGDTDYIPALLERANPERQPYAELWLGAHPDLPSNAEVGGVPVPLHECIRQHPEEILGPDVCRAFGPQLPYLLKVLSARSALSIQVHPSKDRARAGFARENMAGIPISAPNRNYRDENHKPELLAALTDFYALRGFRPLPQIAHVVREVPELTTLMPDFEPTAGRLRALYENFMRLPQAEVDGVLGPLVRRLTDRHQRVAFSKIEREYWILRADREYSRAGHHDRGLFSIYLLNLVHLQPGEAIYLPDGVLHAYLEGSGMEIMANSNNILRGGLTPKYVDVEELLANVEFVGKEAETLHASPIGGTPEWVYNTPAGEFELRRIEVAAAQSHENGIAYSAEIVILVATEGEPRVTAVAGDQTLALRKGDAILVPHGLAYIITATAPARLYKATVPATGPRMGWRRDSGSCPPA